MAPWREGREVVVDESLADKVLLAEVFTEWVWVRQSDGRPAAVPAELVSMAAATTADTLSRRDMRRRRP